MNTVTEITYLGDRCVDIEQEGSLCNEVNTVTEITYLGDNVEQEGNLCNEVIQ